MTTLSLQELQSVLASINRSESTPALLDYRASVIREILTRTGRQH